MSPRFVVAMMLTLGTFACKRPEQAPGNADSSSSPSPSSSLALPSTPPPPRPADTAAPANARNGPQPGEAELRFVAPANVGEDPVLRPYATRVRNHFKDTKTMLTTQRASLFGGGYAMLVRQQTEAFPLLLVEDRERKLLWERARPTGGMTPPVRDPVIVGRPNGGVAMFAYDVPAKVLAGRLTDPDGTPFADLNVIQSEDCQSVSAAYWPRHGLVATCARIGGARLQIVRSDNTLAFPPEGIPVGAAFRAPAPVGIAFDDDAMMLAQHATKDGKDHLFVYRYDGAGIAKWPAPCDVGEVPKLENPSERVTVDGSLRPGTIVIRLPHGLVARPSATLVEVDAAGVPRFP